ncbi:MAG: hypothetical protein K8R67_18365, partial [Desulfobacteraceae bacterium]|nr:hypothetical protein [Desulfobacteraceae bacterium]
MRQKHFEQQNRKLWDEFNGVLKALEKFSLKKIQSKKALRLPFLYRQICNHYALSLSREYSPALVGYLHSMA